MTDLHDPTMGDLVLANPAAARVLDDLGLDYCCHGARSLAEACAAAGLDLEVVASRLADLPQDGDTTWTSLDPQALAAHIVETHHRFLHDELPKLEALAARVASVHAERHAETTAVHRLVEAIRADLEPHLLKEEVILFPAIAALREGRRDFRFGSIEHPIRRMLTEHVRAGELLAALRATTGGFAPPDDACASYRSLYQRLAALELDTHLHVYKENHVLFPAVLRLADPS